MVGDDDSGPEDAEDDLDLECVAGFWLRIWLPNACIGAHLNRKKRGKKARLFFVDFCSFHYFSANLRLKYGPIVLQRNVLRFSDCS